MKKLGFISAIIGLVGLIATSTASLMWLHQPKTPSELR